MTCNSLMHTQDHLAWKQRLNQEIATKNKYDINI